MSASAPHDTPRPHPDSPPGHHLEPSYGYERLSRDREGKKRKVTEQRADIDEHGPRLGFRVVQHFEDNSVSASKYDIDRPGFEALCKALNTSGVRNLLVTEVTRISRQDETGGIFMGIMTRAKGKVVKIPEGITYDFSTSHGRDQFRQALHDAIRESDKISERVRKAQKKLREKQRWTGGPAPFGFKKDVYPELVDGRYETRIRWVVEESEAEHVREMCAAILRGESLSMISERLNQAGVKPRRS
ncbi:recombinase family protein, partial [Frankia sp. EI5c]|uniref:recombinase family protein n=1 Tax=Frankia sp. EI5c TaxID=683316 RepID=UPI0037C12BD3